MVPGYKQVSDTLLAGAAPVTISEKLRKLTRDGDHVCSPYREHLSVDATASLIYG